MNCRDCIARGVEDYKIGDIIGVREASCPVGDEYARTISKRFLPCAVLLPIDVRAWHHLPDDQAQQQGT
ncbi:MAG: hypothetical protein R3D29_09715 [Nitratireductor sp.]